MNNVLKLDLDLLDGSSLDSQFDADFFIRKVSDSKAGYSLWISDEDGYLGKKFSSPQYISTLRIDISKRVKRDGYVLVNFSLYRWPYNHSASDFDSVEVPIRFFNTPSKFIGFINRELEFYFQKMCEAHNVWVKENGK